MLERLYTALHIRDLLATPLFALLDILLLAFIIYQLLKLIRGTRTVNMMIALGFLVALHLISGPGSAIVLANLPSPVGKVYLTVDAEKLRHKLRQQLGDGHAVYYF